MALGYIGMNKYRGNVLGVSVSSIKKSNIILQSSGNLKHYYEWAPNQTIAHERSWLPFVVEAKTNNDGIIGRDDYSLVPPPDVFRIIAIGDSFTEGPYVNPDKTYPRQLEAQLNAFPHCGSVKRYEILNMGVKGHDIEYAASHLISKGPKYHPNLIVWFLKDDDFLERSEVNYEREQKYIELIDTTLGGDVKKFAPYQKFMTVLGHMQNIEDYVHGIAVNEQTEEQAHRRYFVEQERAVYSAASSVEAPIIIVTQTNLTSVFKARLKVWANNKSTIYFYDGIPVLAPEIETFDPNDGHPNEAGYQKIAESIFNHLKASKLLCLEHALVE